MLQLLLGLALIGQVTSIEDLAEKGGVSVEELQGALNSIQERWPDATAEDYLSHQARLAQGPVAATFASKYSARVRLTYYNLGGITASGERVRAGGTACSWNWPMGTRFRFPNGETFVCNDRGLLGSSGWLDVWGRPDLIRLYGSYVTVEVL